MSRRYLLQEAEGAFSSDTSSPYVTHLYRVEYIFNGATRSCYMRLGLPDHVEGEVGFVVLIVGGGSADVVCDEPPPATRNGQDSLVGMPGPFHGPAAAALTSGTSDPDVAAGGSAAFRDADPMITLLFLGPGRGSEAECPEPDGKGRAYAVLSDGDPGIDATPDNAHGDDYYGPMSLAALRACVRNGIHVVGEHYRGRVTPVKIVATHSDGITLGAQYAAEDSELVALVDVEGPMDSLERTVSTECFDPFGAFSPGADCPRSSLPSELTFASWLDCGSLPDTAQPDDTNYCGGHDFFEKAWRRFFRPPADIIEDIREEFRTAKAAGISGSEWLDEPYSPNDDFELDWDYVLDGRLKKFWDNRSAIELLPNRLCAYVRAGCSRDHAQPDHYLGRHNTRALYAASLATTASPADVFWLRDAFADPVRFSKEDINPNLVSGLLQMPDCAGAAPLQGWQIEIDLVRWAFQAWQDGLFPTVDWRACVGSCVGDNYCGDAEAVRDCVEACARATAGHDDAVFEFLSDRWYDMATEWCGR